MLVVAGMLVAGCTTAKAPAPVEEPAPKLAPRPPLPAEPTPQQQVPMVPAPKPPEVTKALPANATPVEPVPHGPERMRIRVESIPAGAMIVVDGMPIGRTPVDVEVGSANNGFFKSPVTIRARFVASDAASESISVDEQLGPLERVPLVLVFSREGAQRVIRRY